MDTIKAVMLAYFENFEIAHFNIARFTRTKWTVFGLNPGKVYLAEHADNSVRHQNTRSFSSIAKHHNVLL